MEIITITFSYQLLNDNLVLVCKQTIVSIKTSKLINIDESIKGMLISTIPTGLNIQCMNFNV